jgi:4-hydroxybenzoate polyprenyltransferase
MTGGSAIHVLQALGRLTRFSDWGPGKVPVLCAVLAYIGLANGAPSARFCVDFALFALFASLHSALGYVANDWGDREIDLAQGKQNALASLPRPRGFAFLAGLCGAALLSGLPFVSRPHLTWLWGAWLFFALGYSLPPVRLKERGRWGLAAAAVAQWTLPVMLAFVALGRTGTADVVVFMAAATVSGATLELAHQRWDRARDRETQTGTFGASTARPALDRLYGAALLCDKLIIGAVTITIAVGIAPLFHAANPLLPGLPLLGIYGVFLAASLRETIASSTRDGRLLDPYYGGGRTWSKLLHETFSNLILPAYLLLLVTIAYPAGVVLLAAFLFWRLVLGGADWRAYLGWI